MELLHDRGVLSRRSRPFPGRLRREGGFCEWFIPDFRVGKAYGLVIREVYLPYESREQVE